MKHGGVGGRIEENVIVNVFLADVDRLNRLHDVALRDGEDETKHQFGFEIIGRRTQKKSA